MLTKPILGVLLALSPLCFLAAVQDPGQRPSTSASLTEEIATLRAQVGQLRAAVDAARTQLEAAQAEVKDVRRQLEESLDMLQESTEPQRRRNCTPSRASLSYYQWLERNGHTERAGTMLDRAIAEHGNEPRRLASMASELMQGDETCGKFDRAALAVAQRLLQRDGELDPRCLDVVAMAHFLNGHVDQAVAFERRASEANNASEYRLRLRLYEAALRNADKPAAGVAVVAAGGE